MALSGHLSELSLPEVFQLLERGRNTGLLSITNSSTSQLHHQQNSQSYYIWFSHGRIMAASNRLDNQGLLYLINQRGWLKPTQALQVSQSCSVTTPMGLCLKSQGVLEGEQLKLLFYVQVIRQVCALFKLKEGWFSFDHSIKLPVAEMTGLSTPATEVTLVGLRALKDWSVLADKLPQETSMLRSTLAGKPNVSINSQEWQVWAFAHGTKSLKEIGLQLALPVEKVQQIAFRLISVGLVEELPVQEELALSPVENVKVNEAKKDGVSANFLQTLVSFLRNKL